MDIQIPIGVLVLAFFFFTAAGVLIIYHPLFKTFSEEDKEDEDTDSDLFI